MNSPTPPPRLKLVILDLDGTLLDSFADIAAALNHGLAANGFPPHSLAAVKTMVGDGIDVLVRRGAPSASKEQLAAILDSMREYYLAHSSDHGLLYPGTEDALRDLRTAGRKLAILTNKPHAIALESCARVGLAELVDAVQGEEPGSPLKPDPAAALRLAERFGAQPAECVVVGDGLPDLKIASAAGMKSIACAWGATPREKLEAESPDAVAGNWQEAIAALHRLFA